MEYSKEDLMEAKKQILGVGENMGTEESKKIWEENAQFWDNAMGDESNEFHREVVRPKVTDKNGTAATYAIDAISDAISKVSSQRSALGAVQNRLEHTIDNLDNISENTSSAESRIRDTDMAKEMVNYSKNNILAQAGQSMLAQANQSNQGVLSLLQ